MGRLLSLLSVALLVAGCAKAPPTPTPAESYSYRAQEALAVSDYSGAWSLYKRAYSRAVVYGDLREQSMALLNLAELATQMWKFSSADSLLRAIPPEWKNQSEVVPLRETIAYKVAAGLGQCDAPLAPSSEVKGEVGARLQLAYALCAVEGGDLSTARDALSQAESLFGSAGAGQLLRVRAALASASGAHAEAARLYGEALEKAREARQPRAIGELLHNLGAAHEALGDRAAAELQYDRAMKLFEQLQIKLPYLKAAQGWLRTSESATEEQKKLFEQQCNQNSGRDLDALLVRPRL